MEDDQQQGSGRFGEIAIAILKARPESVGKRQKFAACGAYLRTIIAT